jgi:hypothetical protein
MKAYKIKIKDGDCDYLYFSHDDPCKFINDLRKCNNIEVEEVERSAVKSIGEIAQIYIAKK